MTQDRIPATHAEVIQRYESLLEQHRAEVKRCDQRWSSVGWARGGLFLASLVPIFLALNEVWGIGQGWMWLSGLLFLCFLVVAFIHEGMQVRLRQASLWVKIYRESIARCQREWDGISVPETEIPKDKIALSTDLDLFTESSLFKLLGITRTPLGTETLQQWMLEGALADEVKLRQEAVAELKPHLKWREDFQLTCEQLAAGQSGPGRFIEWVQADGWLSKRSWILWTARITSVVSIVAILGLFAFPALGLFFWLAVLGAAMLVNFLLSVLYAGQIHDIFNQVTSRTNEAGHTAKLFRWMTKFDASSTRLQQLQQDLSAGGLSAIDDIGRLQSRAWLANMRRNGILFLLYVVLQFLFFWDVHALARLEQWKQGKGDQVRRWFESLGQWEALCSLAKLAADEPQWVFPKVVLADNDATTTVQGKQVAHPLIDTSRVANDVAVGPPGTVLLVTGSNMSGKSTLLRSIGINVVMGQMGSVVCAASFEQPTLQIESSMRIADSLSEGVSFFMAELKRLKQVVDAASVIQRDGGQRRMLFLLDEILQGTNSRERQIAVSRVVRKLIDLKAIGAISTHDLDLGKTDELSSACVPVYFSEQFLELDGQKQMTFDYRMKNGIAETTNALKLLELVGLGE